MCGIIGYIGPRECVNILLQGLQKLEYRGYDSSGVALIQQEQLKVFKKIGKLTKLKKLLEGKNLTARIGIGHTRWATHGGVTDNNAHPHIGCQNKFAIIHNGIIENFKELKTRLSKQGHKFSTETDTEVIAHLIEEKYKNIQRGLKAIGLKEQPVCFFENNLLLEATRQASNELEGSFSVLVVSTQEPDKIIAVRRHSPLVIGIGEKENLIASDVVALLPYTNKVIDMEDDHIAEITSRQIKMINFHGEEKDLKIREVNLDIQSAQKGGYPHFLLKEIHESPQVLRDVFRGKFKQGEVQQESLGLAPYDFNEISKIVMIGCGTASYACLTGKYLFEKWAKITTQMYTGSEFRYHDAVLNDKTLLIAVSQSGETADTLASVRKAKKHSLYGISAIVNVVGSSLARQIDNLCFLNAGPEISVASTKAFTAMITVITLQALAAGKAKGFISSQKEREILQELTLIPEKIAQVLDNGKKIAKVAMQYVNWNSMYYLGRDINYPTALEGALKLKEISYIHAEGYPAGEMKHGPIAVLYEGFPIIAIATKSHIFDKMTSSIQEARARKANVITLTNPSLKEKLADISSHFIEVPETIEELSPIINNIALQLFAYYTALYRGYSIDNPRCLAKYYPLPDEMESPPRSIDIDQPRNLAKSVTVE